MVEVWAFFFFKDFMTVTRTIKKKKKLTGLIEHQTNSFFQM